jgi:hypothetical protein
MFKENLKKIKNMKLSFSNFKFLIIIILFFSLFLRIYWGFEKKGLHIDEVLSISISNHNRVGLVINENKIYTKESLLKKISFDTLSIKDSFKDISKLYKRNADTPHTNFYYSLLRLSFLGRTTNSIENIIFTGIILNCIIFTIGFFALYKLLLLLYDDRPLIAVTLFCSSIAGSAISSSLFLRPYQLQSTMLLLLTYMVFRVVIKKEFTKKMFLLLSFSVAGALLAGYFSIIFIGLLGLLILMYYLIHKDFKRIMHSGVIFLTGSILTQIFYLKYWQTILNGPSRAGEAYAKVNYLYFITNIADSIKTFFYFLSEYALYGISMFLLVIILNLLYISLTKRNNIKVSYPALGIITISILFSIIAIQLAPIKVMRYIMPVFPLISLIIPLGVSTFENKTLKKFLLTAFIIIFLINCLNVQKISYLFKNKLTEATFLENNNSTICILSPAGWRFLEWVPYAKHKQNYIFFNKYKKFINSVTINDANCNFILIDKSYGENDYKEIYSSLNTEFNILSKQLSINDDMVGFEMFKVESKAN